MLFLLLLLLLLLWEFMSQIGRCQPTAGIHCLIVTDTELPQLWLLSDITAAKVTVGTGEGRKSWWQCFCGANSPLCRAVTNSDPLWAGKEQNDWAPQFGTKKIILSECGNNINSQVLQEVCVILHLEACTEKTSVGSYCILPGFIRLKNFVLISFKLC